MVRTNKKVVVSTSGLGNPANLVPRREGCGESSSVHVLVKLTL